MSAGPIENIQSRPGVLAPGGIWHNWGRSASSSPAWVARPTSVAEVVSVVSWASQNSLTVKTVGAGHSFTAIAATDGVLLDLGWIEGLVAVAPDRAQVTVGAGTNLYQLPALLAPYALALTNMGDIDRQTVAGAISTGTHGTGARFGGLSTQVVGATLVIADGSILRVSQTENADLLPAVRLGLGALGVIVDVTLQCVPAFVLAAVERPELLDAVLAEFEDRATAVDHFEFYWWPHTDGVSTKSNTRLPADAGREPLHPLAEWWEDRVLSNGALALMCTVGRFAPNATPAINRLATRLVGNREFIDHSHRVFVSPRVVRFREMEYAIPRAAVPSAMREVRALVEDRGWRISFPIEVRVAAPDDLWLSTAQGRESGYIAVHRHFRDDPEEYFRAVEQIMRGHGGRPHWGKHHFQDAGSLAALYPHFADFLAVRDRLDPDRLFANRYLGRVLGA